MGLTEALQRVLAEEPRVGYALLFGSRARGASRSHSDVDVAVGLSEPMTALELGDLIGRLESAVGLDVDLVVIDEAPAGLAYRVFRDGIPLLERDRAAFVRRKARAVLEYFDFKPIEDLCTRGVLAAASRGR